MNEIMTTAVSQLFTINRSSHCKFFKNSSQLNESKIDIPMGRQSTASLNGVGGNEQLAANAAEWVHTQGRKFLEDSTTRLQIDTKRYTHRDIVITQLSIDELNRVKKNVKNELKKYDQTFKCLFFKEPGKPEKEPLRPLYMYYKKLK